MLRQAEGYIGSAVSCESRAEGVFTVRDFWKSHVDFEAFREKFAADVMRFRQVLVADGVVRRELMLGSFYECDPGPEDNSGLVPA
jgi:hypothetical protein